VQEIQHIQQPTHRTKRNKDKKTDDVTNVDKESVQEIQHTQQPTLRSIRNKDKKIILI